MGGDAARIAPHPLLSVTHSAAASRQKGEEEEDQEKGTLGKVRGKVRQAHAACDGDATRMGAWAKGFDVPRILVHLEVVFKGARPRQLVQRCASSAAGSKVRVLGSWFKGARVGGDVFTHDGGVV